MIELAAAFACVLFSNAASLGFVDPLIGTEGDGSEYGGMQPYTCVPFGSFHAVPMTRTNRVGRLSFNSSDKTLLGIILTRQPAIWMGDWGEVRVEVPPAKIEALDAKPYLTRVTAGGRTYEYTATAHAAWIRGLDAATVSAFPESGINTNRMDFLQARWTRQQFDPRQRDEPSLRLSLQPLRSARKDAAARPADSENVLFDESQGI